jgi:cell wall assembly regulator SMI1
MWIELAAAASPEAQFAPPAAAAAIDQIERQLGQQVPADLRALLLESDGILGEFDEDIVWTAERIAADNASFRANPSFAELYEPFDKLMFFGDNGGGDQFAFVPGQPEAGVLVWEHETDVRRRVADDLADYLQRILTADGDEWFAAGEDDE